MSLWKEPTVSTSETYNMCFACGKDNPIGLKLEFQEEGDVVRSEFTPSELHEGWPGFVHGGILSTILDEAMGYATILQGINCVTAKMEVRLRKQAPVGERLLISSSISHRTKRLIETEATLRLEDGSLVAEGKAMLYVVK